MYTTIRAKEFPTMPVTIMVIGNPIVTVPQLELLVLLFGKISVALEPSISSMFVSCGESQMSMAILSWREVYLRWIPRAYPPSITSRSSSLQLNAVRKSASDPLRAGGGTTQRHKEAHSCLCPCFKLTTLNITRGNILFCFCNVLFVVTSDNFTKT